MGQNTQLQKSAEYFQQQLSDSLAQLAILKVENENLISQVASLSTDIRRSDAVAALLRDEIGQHVRTVTYLTVN